MRSERSQHGEPNPGHICLSGEPDRIGYGDSSDWIPVQWKRRRSAKALVSSTLQYYSDTTALMGRNVFRQKREATGKMNTLSGLRDAGIERRKHLAREHVCEKQPLNESAMMNENTTNEKSRRCQLIVRSEKG